MAIGAAIAATGGLASGVLGGLAATSSSESELRYSLFLGNVVFRVGDADFSANWGWVPVLDFALGLEHAARELLQGKDEAEFEFTESDSAIRFQRDEGGVLISASYAPQRAVVNLEDLVKAVRVFGSGSSTTCH